MATNTRQGKEHKLWLSLMIFGTALLGGCVDMPVRDDPKYAPTYPAAPLPSAQNTGSIYQSGYDIALFQDNKARHVGDILTVVLVEKTAASKKASTDTKKDTKLNIGTPIVFGAPVTLGGKDVLGASAASSNSFAGAGDSSQSNSLSGDISVTVAEVLPNGNLLVRGEKRLTLNQGDEFVQISGIVRPVDIHADNSVQSTQLADARIGYSGHGAVHDANREGWLARFFNSGFWPF
ncbi:MAG: flagellar basal body L-ring protein FlgH [Gammaproteobacteria bacterium]